MKSPAQRISRKHGSDLVSNAGIVVAIEQVRKRLNDSLVKLESVEKSVSENTASIGELTSSFQYTSNQVDEMNKKVEVLEKKVSSL